MLNFQIVLELLKAHQPGPLFLHCLLGVSV
jgi:hypothetical protein